eukprot:6191941-Pleurochrysis_carterae.AAC.5
MNRARCECFFPHQMHARLRIVASYRLSVAFAETSSRLSLICSNAREVASCLMDWFHQKRRWRKCATVPLFKSAAVRQARMHNGGNASNDK